MSEITKDGHEMEGANYNRDGEVPLEHSGRGRDAEARGAYTGTVVSDKTYHCEWDVRVMHGRRGSGYRGTRSVHRCRDDE
jgi:hypothetical protein